MKILLYMLLIFMYFKERIFVKYTKFNFKSQIIPYFSRIKVIVVCIFYSKILKPFFSVNVNNFRFFIRNYLRKPIIPDRISFEKYVSYFIFICFIF